MASRRHPIPAMEEALAYSTLALTVTLAVSRPRVGLRDFRFTPGTAALPRRHGAHAGRHSPVRGHARLGADPVAATPGAHLHHGHDRDRPRSRGVRSPCGVDGGSSAEHLRGGDVHAAVLRQRAHAVPLEQRCRDLAPDADRRRAHHAGSTRVVRRSPKRSRLPCSSRRVSPRS